MHQYRPIPIAVAIMLALSLGCGDDVVAPGPSATLGTVEPAEGHPLGGELIHLRGSGFDPHARVTVWFGQTVARRAIVLTPQAVQVEAPPGAEGETVPVRIEQPGRQVARLERAFTFRTPPPIGGDDHRGHDHEEEDTSSAETVPPSP